MVRPRNTLSVLTDHLARCYTRRFGRPFRANLEGLYPRPKGLGCSVTPFHGENQITLEPHPINSSVVGLGKKHRGACLVGWPVPALRSDIQRNLITNLYDNFTR